MNKIMNYTFRTVYPGVYTDEEKAELARFQEQRDKINKRGPIDLDALVSGALTGTPGITSYVVTEEEAERASRQFDPENPLYSDDKYAQGEGYKARLAWPGFASHDHAFTVPMPKLFRDVLMPTAHEVQTKWHAPIYVGDRLFFVCEYQNVIDGTLGGSVFRTWCITCGGKVYNQEKTLVAEYEIRIQENLRLIDRSATVVVDGEDAAARHERSMKVQNADAEWECSDWWHRPPHVYTDEDYEILMDIWHREKRQGAEPLYWEDVRVGDRPAWTCEGPIRETPHPSMTCGMGMGGGMPRRKEVMDPAIRKTMKRDPRDGIYYMPGDREIDYSKDPDHDVWDYKDYRHNMINYFSRDCAIRMINNWMGDHGKLKEINWLIMPVALGYEDQVGHFRDPLPRRWLSRVPGMEDKRAIEHGLENDTYIVKSYITDKYVKDGHFLAEMVWWIETLDDAIVTEGSATIELPSKNA